MLQDQTYHHHTPSPLPRPPAYLNALFPHIPDPLGQFCVQFVGPPGLIEFHSIDKYFKWRINHSIT